MTRRKLAAASLSAAEADARSSAMPTTTRRAPGGLAAELAALANPAPTPMRTELPEDDFDPSGGAVDPADDSSDGFSGDEDSDGGGDDGDRDDGVFRPTRADRDAGTGGKLRMRAGIALDDEEYVGRSSSRRAMERAWAGEDEDDDDEEEDGVDEEEDDDDEDLVNDESDDEDEDDDHDEEEDEDEDDSDGNDAATFGDGYGIDGEDEQMDDESDDEDEDDDEDDEDDEDDVHVDAVSDPDLEAELAAFREEEAEANRLAAARSQNAVKGAAVRRQNDAWERSLKARILLQRGVNAAAKLPTPAYMDALKASDEGVAPAAATAAGAARGALSALLRLQAALMDGNPAVAESASEDAVVTDGDKKRKARSATAEVSRMHLMASPASEVWRAVDSMYGRYASFRDRSCDRWHRKAQVSVGKMAGGGGPGGRGGGGGEMRAFNQSLSAQVQSAMRLPERLVSRSQPPSHLAPRRLGEPAAAAEEDATAPAEGRDEDVALAAATAAKEGERRVAELYDDADFYEQVLKEFLESAGGGVAGAAAATKPPKRRKVVDRRASKGRKLRYHIQQPLVNFCAPVELEVPAWAEKVFGQLFASKA